MTPEQLRQRRRDRDSKRERYENPITVNMWRGIYLETNEYELYQMVKNDEARQLTEEAQAIACKERRYSDSED